MADLIFYTHPLSRSRVVRWMLEELGVPYEVEVMGYGTSMKSPDYLAINPMGKVPAIRDGDTVVTEVSAICAYLADRFPEKGLAPALGPDRGPYYRWLFFTAGPLEMASTVRAMNWPLDEKAAGMVGCGKPGDAVDALEYAVRGAKPYLCGERFTAVDLVVSSYLNWGMMQKQIDERPAFHEYVGRMVSRPAARRASELDDALAKELAGA